jgi:hypothetical protein
MRALSPSPGKGAPRGFPAPVKAAPGRLAEFVIFLSLRHIWRGGTLFS